MNEVIFDTEADAISHQEADFVAWMSDKTDPDYISGTTCWAVPRQRLDGKWAYECCPNSDYTGMTVEAYQD